MRSAIIFDLLDVSLQPSVIAVLNLIVTATCPSRFVITRIRMHWKE